MELTIYHLLIIVAFVGIVIWAFGRKRKARFEKDAKIPSIAQDVGYDSEASFSRAFKRLVGQPPAAWRRQQRQLR